MGYYCTVPQCTSLAGKTKNVKFHRFPRDNTMADKWNVILKRGKPYTKYSKVCSLHFTQADYNVTTMGKNKGQWKTLSKDAVPSQNLPKLNPDGTVMVIRKTRTVKCKDAAISSPVKSEDGSVTENVTVWTRSPHSNLSNDTVDSSVAYRLQNLNVLANSISPSSQRTNAKPKKQDAYMQTDPLEEDVCNSVSDTSENYSPILYKDYVENQVTYDTERDKYEMDRKLEYKNQELYPQDYQKDSFVEYQHTTYLTDPAEILRHQQHNLQVLQEQNRLGGDGGFFNGNHIKQEVNNEDVPYEQKELSYSGQDPIEVYAEQRVLTEQDQRAVGIQDLAQKNDYYEAQVKTEPDMACENVMSPDSPYYRSSANESAGYYEQALFARQPGPELLIAKQNALSAQTQLWQNTMKRPFFYTESPHYNGSPFLHTRYEDLTRIINQ